jgi:hypothetical protein
MMKKSAMLKSTVFLFFCLLQLGCATIKTVRLLTAGEIEQRHFKVTIPFEQRLGLVILNVKIAGEAYDFVLDTGAPNVLSKKLSDKLRSATVANQDVGDSQGNSSELAFVSIEELELGGLTFKNTGAAVADLSQSLEVGCLNVDGFIGSNLMRTAIWQFDYQNKTITIASSRDSLSIPSGHIRIPFTTALTGTPLIDVAIGEYIDKGVTLDLGSNGDYTSSMTAFEALRQDSQVIQSTYGVGSASAGLYGAGFDTTHFAVLSSFAMGTNVHENPVVEFSRNGAKTIGTNYLKQFDLIIDWFEKEVILIKKPEVESEARGNFGLYPSWEGDKIYVGFVFNQSAAAEAGIVIGDQILAIGGRAIDTVSAEDWCAILDEGLFHGETNQITIAFLREGERKEIQLKEAPLFED